MSPKARRRKQSGRRHRGRELAFRVLFEIEGTGKHASETLAYGADDTGATGDVVTFASALVDGCTRHIEVVDGAISNASANWKLPDLGKVERAILRMATYELLFMPTTPISVVIDESVELAKTYGGQEAGSFVNGVLGSIAAERV